MRDTNGLPHDRRHEATIFNAARAATAQVDIPIGYINGSRAILAIEKGLPGYHAFAEAFAVWEKK